jgi:hypothetical protein
MFGNTLLWFESSEFRCSESAELCLCLLNQCAVEEVRAEKELNVKISERRNTIVCAFDLRVHEYWRTAFNNRYETT